MFRKKTLLLALVLALFSLSACSKSIEGIAIEVDKDNVTIEEYEREFEVKKNLHERQYGEDALSQEGINGKTMAEDIREEIISEMVTDLLIEKESRDKDFEISEEELENYIDEYKELIGGEEEYLDYLEDNKITEEYFREYIGRILLLEKHKEIIMKDLQISEEEARKYFEENKERIVEIRASHMLFSNEKDAKRVVNLLKQGEDFAELAKKESLDSESAANGGDLGYFSRGIRDSEFEDRAFELATGEISHVLKMEVGYHIILVKDRKEDYKELRDKTITMIKEEKYIDYLETLKEDAKITVYI